MNQNLNYKLTEGVVIGQGVRGLLKSLWILMDTSLPFHWPPNNERKISKVKPMGQIANHREERERKDEEMVCSANAKVC